MKIETTKLIGTALDFAVALAEGAVHTPPRATWEQVKDRPVPFHLYEVALTYRGSDLHPLRGEVRSIKVVRCGIDHMIGATAPSITAVDQEGTLFRGSIQDFYCRDIDAKVALQAQLKGDLSDVPEYSTDWLYGGPIIEREKLDISTCGGEDLKEQWRVIAEDDPTIFVEYGPTLLITAMRAYVACKMGAEVEIPDHILEDET